MLYMLHENLIKLSFSVYSCTALYEMKDCIDVKGTENNLKVQAVAIFCNTRGSISLANPTVPLPHLSSQLSCFKVQVLVKKNKEQTHTEVATVVYDITMYRHWYDSYHYLPTMSQIDSADGNTVLKKPFPRAILCVDVDCYEVQVWLKHIYRKYLGQDIPIVIVNRDDMILSINYTARAPPYGISRVMSKQDLRDMENEYPELRVRCTGMRNGHCDTFVPYQESDKIMDVAMRKVMQHGGALVERASRDEFFLDVTEALLKRWDWDVCASNPRLFNARKRYPCKQHDGRPRSILYSGAGATCGYYTGQDIRNRIHKVSAEEALIIQGGIFSELLLDEIYKKTGYYCSAGVGPSKLIAKVASDLNKPAGVAMMTTKAFIRQTSSLPYDKLPGLKRNSGADMRDFYEQEMRRPLKFAGKIRDLSFDQVCEFYHVKGEKDPWEKAKTLCDRVRGIDSDPVQHKLHDNCIGFSYTFRGSHRGRGPNVEDLASDMLERLDYLVEGQGRLPEHLLLRIEYKTRRGLGEVNERFYVNKGDVTRYANGEMELNLDSRQLQDFIWDALDNNIIDLDAAEVLQFRAINCKPLRRN